MQETSYHIQNQDLLLEARVQQQSTDVFLMCHPHPLFAGNMNNKVVTTAIRTAANLGLSSVRFNFRGVGNSTGEHDNGKAEQQDVLAMLDFCRQQLHSKRIFLGGFSFGAGMASLVACQVPEQIAGLFLMAPAVRHFAAPKQLPATFKTHIYMGDADEVVPFADVENWAHSLAPNAQLHRFTQGSHFFHGRLVELKEKLQTHLHELL